MDESDLFASSVSTIRSGFQVASNSGETSLCRAQTATEQSPAGQSARRLEAAMPHREALLRGLRRGVNNSRTTPRPRPQTRLPLSTKWPVVPCLHR